MHLPARQRYSPDMADPPVDRSGALLHFTEGTLAYAGHYLHERSHPVHTHSFIEIAVVTGGEGVHVSPAGRHPLSVGDVVVLRPGVWHGYDACRALDLYNCCFSAELLQRELAWTREDPLYNYLLWTGPYSLHGRGTLTTGLPPMAYLSRLRVETAAAMLLHTDLSITQIAEAVGWPDANYFARRFRAHYGLNASTYRARLPERRAAAHLGAASGGVTPCWSAR